MKATRQKQLTDYAHGIKQIPLGTTFDKNEVQFMLNAKLTQSIEKAIDVVTLLNKTSGYQDYPFELRSHMSQLAVINY